VNFFHYYPYNMNITTEECDTQVFMISRKQKTRGILGSLVSRNKLFERGNSYNIERKFNDKQTSLSVQALHLPKSSSFGNYDGYEVLAYIPNQISWFFQLYSITKHQETAWIGQEEEISFGFRPTRIIVHAINTSTNKFRPVVLEKIINTCSK
jgi:hypothetical protein